MVAAEWPRVRLLLPDRRLEWHDAFARRLAAGHDVGDDGEAAFTIDLSERSDAKPGKVLRPLYDGCPDMKALLGRLQRGECPLIDIAEDGIVIASSYAAIGDSGRLDGRLATVLARVEAMLLRALEEPGTTLRDRPERGAVTFSHLRRLKSAARRLAARIVAPLRPVARPRHWNIALRWDDMPLDLRNFDLAAYAALPVDPAAFYADPFVIARGGRHYLFAEAYPYASGKGEIVCAAIGADGMPGPFTTVLERPWHLSYPFVFEHGGDTYLLPESSSRPGAELFRAADSPAAGSSSALCWGTSASSIRRCSSMRGGCGCSRRCRRPAGRAGTGFSPGTRPRSPAPGHRMCEIRSSPIAEAPGRAAGRCGSGRACCVPPSAASAFMAKRSSGSRSSR